MSTLQQGHIVWALMCDLNGRNSKQRPAVVITATDEIQDDGEVVVVAITSTLEDPLPDGYVLLPWHQQRHPRTGLNKRCAACCKWLVPIKVSDVEQIVGRVPDQEMKTILEQIPRASDT